MPNKITDLGRSRQLKSGKEETQKSVSGHGDPASEGCPVSESGQRKIVRTEKVAAPASGQWGTPPVWLLAEDPKPKRVHLAGLGDVGMNVALGLTLTGAGVVGEIGLYDLNEKQSARMEIELSQIAAPLHISQPFPLVRAVTWEQLFDCEVFLFCATRSVPAVGSGVKDVRMAQDQ